MGIQTCLQTIVRFQLFPNSAKIFEKLTFNRINNHLGKYHLISDKQFGFRQNSSTSHAISNIYEKLIKNSNARMYNCCIFHDLIKAFDTVNHDVLLHKMKNFYEFRGLALKLIQSYLSNRKQYTKMENCKSDLTEIEYGVPHGSSLGPLLFLLYINDLHLASQFDTILFVDDTFLAMSDNNLSKIQNRVNTELRKIDFWMKKKSFSWIIPKLITVFTAWQTTQSLKFDKLQYILEFNQYQSYQIHKMFKNLYWRKP